VDQVHTLAFTCACAVLSFACGVRKSIPFSVKVAPRELLRHFDFPAGRVGGFGVHGGTGSTGGATGAGFRLLYFD
jgi:hypothetical protein